MVDIAEVPANDRFQIVTRHQANELIYPEDGYLGVIYTKDIVFIQVTWLSGRSVEVKKAFCAAIADRIHKRTGLRKEDIFISLIDVARGTGPSAMARYNTPPNKSILIVVRKGPDMAEEWSEVSAASDTALIVGVGSTRGLGAAIARRFARADMPWRSRAGTR